MARTIVNLLPPPWEVLLLVSHHLDPKTLAAASCVCKSWSLAMSSDTVWKPICDAHYHSLSVLRSVDSTLSFRRLFAIATAASKLRRRIPPKPRLALTGLVFVVDISTPEHCSIATMAKPGSDLRPDRDGLFRFEMENSNGGGEFVLPADGNVRVTWNVAVMRGWNAGLFTLMESCGKLGFSAGAEWWLSEQLPPPACCSFGGESDSGVVADVKLVVSGGRGRQNERKVKVQSACVGMMNTVSWRYLAVDDALRYLQHFLAPVDDGLN